MISVHDIQTFYCFAVFYAFANANYMDFAFRQPIGDVLLYFNCFFVMLWIDIVYFLPTRFDFGFWLNIIELNIFSELSVKPLRIDIKHLTLLERIFWYIVWVSELCQQYTVLVCLCNSFCKDFSVIFIPFLSYFVDSVFFFCLVWVQ